MLTGANFCAGFFLSLGARASLPLLSTMRARLARLIRQTSAPTGRPAGKLDANADDGADADDTPPPRKLSLASDCANKRACEMEIFHAADRNDIGAPSWQVRELSEKRASARARAPCACDALIEVQS